MMTQHSKQQRPSQSSPENPAIAELKAIRQLLEENKKEVTALRKGLTNSVASGFVIGSIFMAVVTAIFGVSIAYSHTETQQLDSQLEYCVKYPLSCQK
jgi:hypothetical protein